MRNKPVDKFMLVLGALILTAIFVAVLVVSSSGNVYTGIIEHESPTGFDYQTLILEGMPCILWKERGNKRAYGGLTCNWDHWTGSKREWVNDRQ